MLIKTLRTTLGVHDPTCAAQGPVWALCTLGALIVLLGPALVTNVKLTNSVKGLLALSVRHKKSSVRALACALWRSLAWVYFRPPLPQRNNEQEGEDEEWGDEGTSTKAAAWTPAEEARRVEFWKVVATMVDMGAGVGTVAALLACKSDNVRSVSRAIALLDTMVQRGGNMCHDAVQTLCQLVSSPSPSRHGGETEEDMDWDWGKLLPSGLFSADPGLLTIDFGSLSEEVRKVIKQTPSVADVRALSAAELWMPGVMDGLIKVWRTALTQVCLSSDAMLPASRSSYPSSIEWLICYLSLLWCSPNSSSHGTVSLRRHSAACKAQLTATTTTTTMAKMTTNWCRSLPSSPYR